ncbi:MAG: hypothetical protein IT204_11020 [Fimbriimonadaceae bacterium]|nr:hypothetical protein [Fimbriimonadaceae bacterium]
MILGLLCGLLTALPESAPPLPPPSGLVVHVRTADELFRAAATAVDGTTIVLAPGAYQLDKPIGLGVGRQVRQVSIRGATGRPEDVIVRGAGMNNLAVPHGFYFDQAADCLLADLTVGWVGYHPVMLNGAGVQRLRVYHCRLLEAGEQFIKGSVPQGYGRGASGGVVEYCHFEYAQQGPPNGYTQGVDIHGGAGWVVRHNRFVNITSPPGARYTSVPAVLFWNGSRDTLCEGNLFVNCDRGIAYGLGLRPQGPDHQGGIIRNNVILTEPGKVAHPDAGILVWDSPDTQVLHNSVRLNGVYPNAIEVRFANSRHCVVRGNLCDAAIVARTDGELLASDNVVGPLAAGLPRDGGPPPGVLPTVARVAECLFDFLGAARPEQAAVGAHQAALRPME